MQENRILTSHSIDDEEFCLSDSLYGSIRFTCDIKSQYLSPQKYKVIYGVRDEANNNIIKNKNPLQISIESVKNIDGGNGVLVNAGRWNLIK